MTWLLVTGFIAGVIGLRAGLDLHFMNALVVTMLSTILLLVVLGFTNLLPQRNPTFGDLRTFKDLARRIAQGAQAPSESQGSA